MMCLLVWFSGVVVVFSFFFLNSRCKYYFLAELFRLYPTESLLSRSPLPEVLAFTVPHFFSSPCEK